MKCMREQSVPSPVIAVLFIPTKVEFLALCIPRSIVGPRPIRFQKIVDAHPFFFGHTSTVLDGASMSQLRKTIQNCRLFNSTNPLNWRRLFSNIGKLRPSPMFYCQHESRQHIERRSLPRPAASNYVLLMRRRAIPKKHND